MDESECGYTNECCGLETPQKDQLPIKIVSTFCSPVGGYPSFIRSNDIGWGLLVDLELFSRGWFYKKFVTVSILNWNIGLIPIEILTLSRKSRRLQRCQTSVKVCFACYLCSQSLGMIDNVWRASKKIIRECFFHSFAGSKDLSGE